VPNRALLDYAEGSITLPLVAGVYAEDYNYYNVRTKAHVRPTFEPNGVAPHNEGSPISIRLEDRKALLGAIGTAPYISGGDITIEIHSYKGIYGSPIVLTEE